MRSVDLEAIKRTWLSAEVSEFSKVSNTPPDVCVDTSLSHNSSNFASGTTETEPVMLSTQDMKVLEILEQLENNINGNFTGCEHKYNIDDSRMKGYFCSDTFFNLSIKVLREDKRLSDVPGRPVISNCGVPTEKVSEFSDYQLKPVMQNGKLYIRDSGHFLEKIKNISTLPENAILVTADVGGLYPSIPHQAGLKKLFRIG